MPYIGKAPQLQGAYDKADDITGTFDGVETVFDIKVSTVSKVVGKSTNLIVNIDPLGVNTDRYMLEPDVDYTVSGSSITFSIAPEATDYIWIVILGDVGSV